MFVSCVDVSKVTSSSLLLTAAASCSVYSSRLLLVLSTHQLFLSAQMTVCSPPSLIRPQAAAVRPSAPDCRPDQASDSPVLPLPPAAPRASACYEYTLATQELCSSQFKKNNNSSSYPVLPFYLPGCVSAGLGERRSL